MAKPLATPPAPPVDRAANEAARARLHAEMKPEGVLQTLVVDEIARAMARLALAAEWEDLVEPGDPRWLRYHAQAERSIYRGLAELRRLVKDAARAIVDAARPEVAATVEPPIKAATPVPATAAPEAVVVADPPPAESPRSAPIIAAAEPASPRYTPPTPEMIRQNPGWESRLLTLAAGAS